MKRFPWTRPDRQKARDESPERVVALDDAIEFIARIDREIHSTEVEDLEVLASRIVAVMGDALRCIGGALLLVDDDQKVLRPFVYSSISSFVEKVIPLLSKPFQDHLFDLSTPRNLTARTAVEGRTFTGNDYAEFLAPTVAAGVARRIQRLIRMRTIATAPALLGDRVLGVLMVGFREPALDVRRGRLLELFAGQCAVAIHNARRHGEVSRLLERERELTVRLRSADKMKSDLLLMAGHELRTPLAAVRYGLEGMAFLPALSSDPAYRKQSHQLIDQIERLNALVDDMCEALKAADGQLELTGKPVQLDALLRALVERRSAEFQEHRVSVTVHDPAGFVPPVLGDEARLRYAFWEIVTNAVKHGGRGVAIDIHLRRERHPEGGRGGGSDGVLVEIRDNGVGIAKAVRDRLFGEQFVVTPDLDHKSAPGMGIGLYLVNKIVEVHRGTVEISSTPNQLTTVSIWLPELGPKPARSP